MKYHLLSLRSIWTGIFNGRPSRRDTRYTEGELDFGEPLLELLGSEFSGERSTGTDLAMPAP